MSNGYCIKCGAKLNGDDVGAHKKLINRGAEEFMCVPCLASYFGVTEQTVRDKIEEFRKMGCTLFSPKN